MDRTTLCNKNTPGRQSPIIHNCTMLSDHSDSGGSQRKVCNVLGESEHPIGHANKIRFKQLNFIATLNVQSLMKLGKLKTITDFLDKKNHYDNSHPGNSLCR